MSVNFKMDRTAFEAVSFEEANKKNSSFGKHTWKERLQVAGYLIAAAYNYPADNPPKMDKTYFEIKSYNG